MSSTIAPVIIPIDTLPATMGASLWSDRGEWHLSAFTWNVVRRMCAGEIRGGGRIHRQEQADLESIASDGLEWNLRRYRQTAWKRTTDRDSRRFAAAFLVGCLVRSMLARDRPTSVAIGKMIANLGYRDAALITWRGMIPLLKNGGYRDEQRINPS